MSYRSRILIVDDQALMRNHMHRLLADEGYELEFAEDGRKALDKIESFRPDLILLDVRMPVMDGFEVCRRVRENPATAEIPIIMITAFDDRHARMEGIQAGADDFIPKPYDSLELRARVRTITRLNRFRRLMDEKAKFQLVAELSENGYLLINDSDQVVFANHQARLYLNLPVEMDTPIDQTFTELVQGRYQRESAQSWDPWPGWNENKEARYLVRPETVHAPALWLQVDTLDHLLSGSQMVWVVSLRDVTNQMTVRQDMWKFQRAIHHKMRTPLIGMYSGIQFLANYVSELSAEDVQALLATALEHGERLRGAVEDVLRYLDTPNFAHVGNQITLRMVAEAAREMGEALELKSCTVELDEAIAEEALVLSQESMEVILWELLENAKKFHPDHSPDVLVNLEAAAEKGSAAVLILDNGTSLTPEQLQHIWQPYYQSEKSFTGEIEGMGLGLPTVASVLWGVGGKCQLLNRPDGPGVEAQLIIPFISQNDLLNREKEFEEVED